MDIAPMWRFIIERRPDGAVVFLSGELDMCSSPDAGRMLLAELGRTETARLIADLAGLRFLDATTINALVRVHAAARDTGRSFTVRRPRPLIRHALQATGTLDLLSRDR